MEAVEEKFVYLMAGPQFAGLLVCFFSLDW
jgi:hypothetical protein